MPGTPQDMTMIDSLVGSWSWKRERAIRKRLLRYAGTHMIGNLILRGAALRPRGLGGSVSQSHSGRLMRYLAATALSE